MLINKTTKDYIDRIDLPNEDWIGDNSHYLVDSNSELAVKIRELHPNYDFVLDDKGNLTDVCVQLNAIINNKIKEMDNACKQTIYNGLDITLEDGTVEHFTLDEQDQLNLSGIGLKLLMGAEIVAWHEDDETVPCRFYSAVDATKIIGTLTTWKEYHITYFRDLRIYVKSLNSIEEVNSVFYGMVLPDEFKSEVLIAYEQELFKE